MGVIMKKNIKFFLLFCLISFEIFGSFQSKAVDPVQSTSSFDTSNEISQPIPVSFPIGSFTKYIPEKVTCLSSYHDFKEEEKTNLYIEALLIFNPYTVWLLPATGPFFIWDVHKHRVFKKLIQLLEEAQKGEGIVFDKFVRDVNKINSSLSKEAIATFIESANDNFELCRGKRYLSYRKIVKFVAETLSSP
jgi:hypothetical protein